MKMRTIKIPNDQAIEIIRVIRKAIYSGSKNLQFMISDKLYNNLFAGNAETSKIPFKVQQFCEGWWHITSLTDIADEYFDTWSKANEIWWMQFEKEETIEFITE